MQSVFGTPLLSHSKPGGALPCCTLSQKAIPALSARLSGVLVSFTDLYIRAGGDLAALWCEKGEPLAVLPHSVSVLLSAGEQGGLDDSQRLDQEWRPSKEIILNDN